jgi:hypothetical protein
MPHLTHTWLWYGRLPSCGLCSFAIFFLFSFLIYRTQCARAFLRTSPSTSCHWPISTRENLQPFQPCAHPAYILSRTAPCIKEIGSYWASGHTRCGEACGKPSLYLPSLASRSSPYVRFIYI